MLFCFKNSINCPHVFYILSVTLDLWKFDCLPSDLLKICPQCPLFLISLFFYFVCLFFFFFYFFSSSSRFVPASASISISISIFIIYFSHIFLLHNLSITLFFSPISPLFSFWILFFTGPNLFIFPLFLLLLLCCFSIFYCLSVSISVCNCFVTVCWSSLSSSVVRQPPSGRCPANHRCHSAIVQLSSANCHFPTTACCYPGSTWPLFGESPMFGHQ